MKRNILRTIDDKMSGFSKSQKILAIYLKDHYEKAAYMTASKLGKETGVSESTVVRFVTELGFGGYHEFQVALRELTRSKLTAFQRVEMTNSLIGDENVLDKVLESDIDKIKHTIYSINRDTFNCAVKYISNAKTIYIVGMRASSFLAEFLNYGLRMIYDNVHLIQTTSGSETFEQMLGIGKGDVLIAVSFPRYSKAVVRCVDFSSKSGAEVIALTDSHESPIADSSSCVLVAQSDMASFMDSLVAPLSVINALIVAVAREGGEDVVERLHRLEKIWDEYNTYEKNDH